jgi:hypothetical protein
MQDIDWIWHQYRVSHDKIGKRTVNHIMFIEEKPNSCDLSNAQRDTMYLIHQLCLYADKVNSKKFRTLKGDLVRVRYWGYFKLRYEGIEIKHAKWIEWNNKEIDLNILENILLFNISPRTLQPLSDRRHHPIKSQPLLEIL